MADQKKEISIIARNIRKFRKKQNISQDRLSKIADISVTTISKIEAGDTPNPTIETVQKIANSLGVGIDELTK